MSNQFLELNHYNASNINQLCSLQYSGSNFLDGQRYLWPYKFKINTNNYPLYIPTLIQSFNPFNIDATTESVLPTTNYHMMDWAITIQFADTTSKTTPVYWQKPGDVLASSSSLIDNPYFWINNSDELTIMINNAFSRITHVSHSKDVLLCKDNDRWTLLIKQDSNILSIHFNDSMKKYFGFNYGLNNAITAEYVQSFVIDDNVYWSITSPMSNNKLFPFDKLIFKSDSLNLPPMKIQNYDANVLNNSSSTILSYDLSISDISAVSTSMSFVTHDKDRSLSLNTDRLPNSFNIVPYLVTQKGEEYRLNLKPGEKVSISIMFY